MEIALEKVEFVETDCAPEGLTNVAPNVALAKGVSGAKLTPLKSSVIVKSTCTSWLDEDVLITDGVNVRPFNCGGVVSDGFEETVT